MLGQWTQTKETSYSESLKGLKKLLSKALAAAAAAKSLQSCPTLCDPIDGSPPDSPVPGILQERTLEWGAISFSNAWKWKGKVKSLSHVQLLATPWTAAYQALPSMGFSRQEYWTGVPLSSPSKALSFPQWTKEGSRGLRHIEAMEYWGSSSISWWQSWDCQQSLHIHIFHPKEKRLNESLLGTTMIQTSLTNPRPTWKRQGSGNGEDQVLHGTGPGAVWREIKGLEPQGACLQVRSTASTK